MFLFARSKKSNAASSKQRLFENLVEVSLLSPWQIMPYAIYSDTSGGSPLVIVLPDRQETIQLINSEEVLFIYCVSSIYLASASS